MFRIVAKNVEIPNLVKSFDFFELLFWHTDFAKITFGGTGDVKKCNIP